MFNITLEESQLTQQRYQELATAWRKQRKLSRRKPFQRTILLKTADLLIHSGTQLKNHLQPA